MADPLVESIAALCGALKGLRDHVQSLAHVHDAIDEFNGVFGTFQNAMALHASCLAFASPPKPSLTMPPPRPTGIPKPQIAPGAVVDAMAPSAGSARGSDASNGAAVANAKAAAADAKKKRPSSSPVGTLPKPTGVKKKASLGKKPAAKARAAAAAATAAAQRNTRPETAPWKWDKNIRDNIPRKYQSEAELAKLENILVYLKNRPGGVTIADLVKHSALAAIRCKEILQTLTKLNLIARRQETVGFVYTFGGEL